jgi:hypothetical protein
LSTSAFDAPASAAVRVPRFPLVLLAPVLAFVVFLDMVSRGPDYEAYASYYDAIVWCFNCFESQEVGFQLLALAGQKLSMAFTTFHYWLVAFCVAVKLFVLERTPRQAAWLAVVFYVTSFFVLHELVQLRFALAAALVYLAAYFSFLRVNRIAALACLAIAVQFHASAAIFGLAYVLYLLPARLLFAGAAVLAVVVMLGRFELTPDLVEEVIFSERVTGYIYSFIVGEAEPVNVFSVQTLDTVLCVALFWLTRSWRTGDAGFQRLVHFFWLLMLVSLPVKLMTLQVPVLSFRLFEALNLGAPLVKAALVWRAARIDPGAGVLLFVLLLAANVYVYLLSGAIAWA